jgi:hypothetical protein
MTSTKQISANQKNALKSTGPRTEEGKSTIALNAMKHGLHSKEVLLPDEDKKTLVEFGTRLRSQLQPIGELESLLVDRLVASAWRLRRILVIEIGMFKKKPVDCFSEEQSLDEIFQDNSDGFSQLNRYETCIEKSLYKALHELQGLQATRNDGNDPVSP